MKATIAESWNKFLKSVISNFTLAVRYAHRPRLTFCLMLEKKREKIWLGQDLNPRSVDQKSIVLTITSLVPCKIISQSIYVTFIVMSLLPE